MEVGVGYEGLGVFMVRRVGWGVFTLEMESRTHPHSSPVRIFAQKIVPPHDMSDPKITR